MKLIPCNFPARRAVAALVCVAAAASAFAQDIVLGQTASFKNPLVTSLSREYNAGIELALKRANAAEIGRAHV